LDDAVYKAAIEGQRVAVVPDEIVDGGDAASVLDGRDLCTTKVTDVGEEPGGVLAVRFARKDAGARALFPCE
jgi:hypothetical protein